MLQIGILKENQEDARVACSPESVSALIKLKTEVWLEKGAGIRASFSDEDYEKAGARIANRDEILDKSALLLAINIPDTASRKRASKAVWLGAFQAMSNAIEIQEWAQEHSLVFSLDLLPRSTRAQSMDVLSSQANIAGYKAVLLAANVFPRYFPMLMTAAGSIPPAKVLILGAGVAGLQAIATARRLGAVVHVFDTRPAVKEEVMSLGAKFVEVEGAADASKAGGYAVQQTDEFQKRQKDKIAEFTAKSDILITTAQIPGKKAPILITKEMIGQMRSGSVIIDLAAATGGNTEVTVNNQLIVASGVAVIGNSNLPSDMPSDASKLLGKNFAQFLKLLIDKDGNYAPDFGDELIRESCACKEGKVANERVKKVLEEI